MDPEGKKFGRGPRELTGALDLISYYRLLPHYEHYCKRALPLSISDTQYLQNVVGDTEIRKGEGMQLDQLIQDTHNSRDIRTKIQPFDLNILCEAFHLRETIPVDLPLSEKGTPTIAAKLISESKEKDKEHKKHKNRDKEKVKEHKEHKHRHRDRSKYKDKKDKSGHHHKKRKHDGDEEIGDIHKHKKSKHKSSKINEVGAIWVAG